MTTKKILVDCLFLGFFAALVYLPVLNGFFAQDEWNAFGTYINQRSQVIWDGLVPSRGHYVPLTHLANYSLFKLFGLSYSRYAATSILLHSIATGLVYLFLSDLTKNRKIALTTGLLFAISASGYQATSWVLADLASHMAVISGIFACLLFLRGSKMASVVILFISLLFKEITIGLFAWLIVYQWLKNKKFSASLLLVALAYVIIRGLGAFAIPPSQIVAPYQRTPLEAAYSALTLPVKALAQTLAPPSQIFNWSYSLANRAKGLIPARFGTTAFDRFVESYVFEPANLFIFFLIVSFALKERKSRLVWLGIFWTIVNSLVYFLSPGRSGVILEIESRNLYLPAMGTLLFLVLTINSLIKSNLKYLIVVTIIVLSYINVLEKSLTKISAEGQIRRQILAQIRFEHPVLPSQSVFYFESDRSYYGLPDTEQILPFQSGLGQTLLVWYYNSQKFSPEFFQNDYLWDLESQGYKQVGTQGFGYFRKFGPLEQAVVQNQLPLESVIAYRFNSSQNVLYDITSEIRNRLQ